MTERDPKEAAARELHETVLGEDIADIDLPGEVPVLPLDLSTEPCVHSP